jgi:hypothetical protein
MENGRCPALGAWDISHSENTASSEQAHAQLSAHTGAARVRFFVCGGGRRTQAGAGGAGEQEGLNKG